MSPEFLANRILRLVDEHGAPNSFGLQELTLQHSPPSIARAIKKNIADIRLQLYPHNIDVTYRPPVGTPKGRTQAVLVVSPVWKD